MGEKELPKNWIKVALDDVANPVRVIIRPLDRPELPFISLEHIEAETMKLLEIGFNKDMKSQTLHFSPEDVLYGRLRPYLNKVFRPDFEGTCSAEFIVFPRNAHIESRYLQYFLNSWNFKEFASHLNAGDRPRVDWDQLKVFPFPLSPLAEQQRIVEVIEQKFSCLDEGVTLLRRAQKRLKLYRASVLKAAVEGELTAEWRAAHTDLEPASELLQRILAERRAKWEEELIAKGRDPKKAKYEEPLGPSVNGLTELPEGWCWVTVAQLVLRSEYGTSVKCDYDAVDGIPVLRIPNIAGGEIDLNDIKYSVQPLTINGNSALIPGDVLVCRTNGSINLIGKAALVKKPLDKLYTFASYLLRFRLLESSILPSWFHSYLASPQGRTFIEKNAASSAGQHNISLTLIHSLAFPLPPLAEQEQIVTLVEERLSIVSELESTIKKALKRAERQRQSILHQAFTGKLVPQNPEDEPAGVLLERIRQEREQEKQKKQAIEIKPQTSKNKKPASTAQITWLPDKPFEPIDSTGIAQDSLWQETEAADVSILADGTGNNGAGGEREQDGSHSAILQSGTQK